jgi:hypothetical protein
LDNMTTISPTGAPNTLRIPISFFRRTAMNEMRPYKPKQEIKIATPENIL